MSTALGIAGVTATLESILNSVFNPGAGLGSVKITAVAPDVIQKALDQDTNPNQINLFLHQVTHNAAWRNSGMPSLGPDGKTAIKNQPLALDLHYLLTAYTPDDGFAEALLGWALLTLHNNPTLSRAQVTGALAALPSTHPLFAQLQTTGLADQIELLKITPDTLGREEMAWIWTALKADYRPTYAFQISVVLLQVPAAVSSALPVMTRNITAQPGPWPALFDITLPANQAAAAPGDTVTLKGEALGAVKKVRLTNRRFGFSYPADITPTFVTGTAVSFVVPNDPLLPAGIYSVAALIPESGTDVIQSTNLLTLGVAPVFIGLPGAANTPDGTLVTANFNPQARPEQDISLAMGGTAVPPQPFTSGTNTLTFLFPTPGLPAGSYVVRLQIDGVDSTVTWTSSPPAFTSPIVTVP
ncbi:MAG TPA: DUF4255 domain-containing protein [Bryobacteraceae bacterium]|nr:DUF4255 domain-containing protein [Bryobacteraceae bacterium]